MRKNVARFLRILLLLFFWTSPALAQDICVSSLPEGHDDFCEVQGPCGPGDGNCKNDVECVLGLECLVDAGLTYGLEPHVDVCGVRLGGMFYCAVEGPCGTGQERVPLRATEDVS